MAGTSEAAGNLKGLSAVDGPGIKSRVKTGRLRQTVSLRGNSGGRDIGFETVRESTNLLILKQYLFHSSAPHFFGIKLVLTLNLIQNKTPFTILKII